MICTQNGKGEIYNEIPLLLQIKQSDIPNHHLHPQNVNVPINTLESWRLLSTIVIFQQSVGKKKQKLGQYLWREKRQRVRPKTLIISHSIHAA